MKILKLAVLVLPIVMSFSSCSFEASTAKIPEAKLYRDEAATQVAEVFGQSDTFYLVAELAGAPDATVTKSRWLAADVEGEVPKDHLLKEMELESGSGTLTFNLSNDQLWPKGLYRVELLLGDKVEQSLEFRVE